MYNRSALLSAAVASRAVLSASTMSSPPSVHFARLDEDECTDVDCSRLRRLIGTDMRRTDRFIKALLPLPIERL